MLPVCTSSTSKALITAYTNFDSPNTSEQSAHIIHSNSALSCMENPMNSSFTSFITPIPLRNKSIPLLILFAAFSLFFTGGKPVKAQEIIFEESTESFPGDSLSQDVALGDLDSDGDLDAVVANEGINNTVWLNQGGKQGGIPGTFIELKNALSNSGGKSRTVKLGDLNGNGALDIIFANYEGLTQIWINHLHNDNAEANFQVTNLNGTNGAGKSIDIAVGDIIGSDIIDNEKVGDGYLDIVVANEGPNEIWKNNGNGTFERKDGLFGFINDDGNFLSQNPDLKSVGIAIGDFDGDKLLDIYESYIPTNIEDIPEPESQETQLSTVKIWQNTEAGKFTDIDSSNEMHLGCEVDFSASPKVKFEFPLLKFRFFYVRQEVCSSGEVLLDDFNFDNKQDVFTLNTHLIQSFQEWDTGWISVLSLPSLTYSEPPRRYDISNQLLVRTDINQSIGGLIRFNQDSEHELKNFPLGNTMNVAHGDIDGDGRNDIFIANSTSGQNTSYDDIGNRIVLNQAGRKFVSHRSVIGASNSRAAALGDIDGDADLDVFVANYNQPNKIWLNSSFSSFRVDATTLGLGDDYSTDVAVGDFDGNSTLDLFFTNSGAPNQIWLNQRDPDPIGVFDKAVVDENNESSFLTDMDNSQGVALAYLDEGNVLDAVVVNFKGRNIVYPNIRMEDGRLISDPEIPFGRPNSKSMDVVLGKLNGKDDGLDIFIVNRYEPHEAWFIDKNKPLGEQLGIYHQDSTADELDSLPVEIIPNTARSWSAVLGDLEGTKNEPNSNGLDVFIANEYVDPNYDVESNTLLINTTGDNNDTPTFEPLLTGDTKRDSMAAIIDDLDGDGEWDILVGNYEQDYHVLFSQHNPENNRLEGFVQRSGSLGQELKLFDIDLTIPNANLDGDTVNDLALANSGPNGIWLNVESLQDTRQSLGSATSLAVEIAYLDETVTSEPDTNGEIKITCDSALGSECTPDVVFANTSGNSVWLNLKDSPGTFRAVGPRFTSDNSHGVALGDIDGNNYLDIFVANHAGASVFWTNDADGIALEGMSINVGNSNAAAFGDFDDDNDLDLFIANGDGDGEENIILRNGGESETRFDPILERFIVTYDSDVRTASENLTVYNSKDVAIGDLDGDEDLDAVVANLNGPNTIWKNSKQQDQNNANFEVCGLSGCGWEPTDSVSQTEGVALGDLDQDGDLDIVFANSGGQKSTIWFNHGNGTFGTAPVQSIDSSDGKDVALGDVDNDGDLDILIINGSGQPNHLWINQGFYQNDQLGKFESGQFLDNLTYTPTGAFGDVDGDTDLDIVAGNGVWINQGAAQAGIVGKFRRENSNEISPIGNSATQAIALGDIDRDGDLDVVVANGQTALNGGATVDSDTINQIFLGVTGSRARQGIVARRPGQTALADFYSIPSFLAGTIPIEFEIGSSDDSNIEDVIAAYYSLDGGGKWVLIKSDALSGDECKERVPELDQNRILCWDTVESGVFGQTDNMVLRFELRSQPSPTKPGTILYRDAIPLPRMWPTVSNTTLPFRVQGVQIRVSSEEDEDSGAYIYRKSEGQDRADRFPLETDVYGNLRGRGALDDDDEIVALQPIDSSSEITFTNKVTLYLTSNSQVGLRKVDLNDSVQPLTVSRENKLLVFDLDISLEWDAQKDSDYLEQLEEDIKRASDILFDLSNGYMSFGNVKIYNDGGNWTAPTTDVRIYATNDLRPNANLGGIVTTTISETVWIPDPNTGERVAKIIPDAIRPGLINIGATWNRYGNPDGTVGEDWPRVLVHEFGHYALFLLDNYLGFESIEIETPVGDQAGSGQILIATDCVGSAMTDAYREEYSEFLDEGDWNDECESTLAEQTTGRSDWETIKTYYKPLADLVIEPNAGPDKLPINITSVTFITNPESSEQTIETPLIYIEQTQGGLLPLQDGDAHAFLYKDTNGDGESNRIIPLGTPNGPLIEARGAAKDDRFCLFDTAHQPARTGCIVIGDSTTLSKTVRLQEVTISGEIDWRPQLKISPVNTTTLDIEVTQETDGGSIQIQLFPSNWQTATSAVSWSLDPVEEGGDTHTKRITQELPILGGHIRIWIEDGCLGEENVINPTIPYCEAVIPFAFSWGWDGNAVGFYADTFPGNASPGNAVGFYTSEFPGNAVGFYASSNDSQAIILNAANIFYSEVGTVMQVLTVPPKIPSWQTIVGQAIRYQTDRPPPDTQTILFQYLERELPDIPENRLSIYYSPDEGETWVQLDTQVDALHNHASAPAPGPGIYAIMATIEAPALQSEWNSFSYPDTNERPVDEALESIETKYMSVFKRVDEDAEGRPIEPVWRLFDPLVEIDHPEFAVCINDLETLKPLESYWVYVIMDTIPYISVPVADNTKELRASGITELPPATFFGRLLPTDNFTPTVGSEVVAKIGDSVCGTAVVTDSLPRKSYEYMSLGDDSSAKNTYMPFIATKREFYYKMQIRADTGDGCGVFGHDITFYIDGQKMENNHPWGNSQACYLNLGPPSEALPTTCFTVPAREPEQAPETLAADLIVEEVSILENGLEVVLKNKGNAQIPAGAGFWVDAYINPEPQHLPLSLAVNNTWSDYGGQGLVWGLVDLSNPLAPNETITLTVDSPYFMPEHSNIGDGWTDAITTTVYVQVDSVHTETNYGGILERHEILGEEYNNVWTNYAAQNTTPGAITPTETIIYLDTTGSLPLR